MAPPNPESREFSITLSEEERSLLLTFLEQELKDKQIEEHRTKTFDFKEHIQHQEALLKGLIDKLQRG